MDEEKPDNRRHPKKMHDTSEFVTAEEPSQLLELHRLPDAEAREDRDQDRAEHAPVEDLLPRIVFAEPVVELEAQGRPDVVQEGAGAERQKIAPEMARRKP